MDTYCQTTQEYDKKFDQIQEEFMQLFDESEKVFVSQGGEFITSLIRNQKHEILIPMSLSHYCLLQTMWALSSGNVELAETYTNRTDCYSSDSESWLENFQFDPSWVFNVVKSASEGNGMFKRIAVPLSRNYDVLIKAAERADDSLIIWLKESGLDLSLNGIEAVGNAWVRDHVETVSLLLKMGAFGDNSAKDVVNLSNSRGETLLHFAADRGFKEIAQKLLNDGAEVNRKDAKSLTPLYHAMRANDGEMVRLLTNNDADPWTRSHNGNTLLHLAVMENSTVALSFMLSYFWLNVFKQQRYDVNAENNEEMTPLFLAVERGYDELREWLIYYRADPNYQTKSGDRLLHIAVKRGSLIAIKNLLKYGASVDSANLEGLTPLYLAAKNGNSDLILFLLNKGAACKASLLHIAAGRGDTTAIESLVSFCVPVDALNENGVTPLYSAASAGQRAAMEFLLALGADLYITLRNGGKLLHVAAVAGDLVAMRSLLDVGIHVDVKDTDMLSGLCRAVQTDNIVSLELLIEKGADTSFRTPVGDTLLHLAAVSNSFKSIKYLVNLGLNIEAENNQNGTPLYLAAKSKNEQAAKLLISLGANRNHVTSEGGTLAHLAVERNDVAALVTLVNVGVDFNLIDKEGYTPLYDAIRKTEFETATFMLESGVDLFYINRDNDSLLHIAGRKKHHKAIDFLIDRGMHVDFKGSNGSRPIDVALFEGNCDTAEHFITKGANTRGRNGMNRTIVHSAVIGGCVSFLKKIAVQIDNIDPKDQNGQTPLHLAAALGRADISDTLMLLGADVNSLDKFNSTPFQIAAINRNWNMVSSFLKKDVKLDWTDSHKRTLLHLATLENEEGIVKYLTEKLRVNVNVKDADGRNPLHLAAEKGWLQIMRYLVDERFPESMEQQDNEGKTPLHLAAIGGHKSVVEYLLEKGADPQVKDRFGQTPLIYAAKLHNWETVNRLLVKMCMVYRTNNTDEQGRTVLHLAILNKQIDVISSYKQCLNNSINIEDSNGRIPLHLAAEEGLSQVMSYLIDESVVENIDHRDNEEKTPLHLAAIRGNKPGVTYILEKGADPQAKDRIGQTPLIYAAKYHNWDIVSIILNRICMISSTNNTDEHGRTVLHLAVLDEQINIISSYKRCLKKLINSKDFNDETPLDLAIAMRNSNIVKNFFTNYRSVLKVKDCIALTLAEAGFWEVVRSLSATEVGSECRDEKNRTLLHLAAMQGDEDTVLSLIENRIADLDATDANNRTALHLASTEDRHQIIRILLKHGARIDMIDKDRMTPLSIALTHKSWATVRQLLENESEDYNRTVLYHAAINGQKEIIEYLLKNTKIGINAKDANLDTILQLVAAQRNLSSHDRQDIMDDLILHGADWKTLDKKDRNILHLITLSGDVETLKYIIIRYRLDINGQDVNSQTPLHLAIINEHQNMVETLLENEADRNILDINNYTPLVYAIQGRFDAVNLLDEHTDIYWLDMNNRSILHLAAMYGCPGVVGKLLNSVSSNAKKIIIDRLDINEQTPLHLAAFGNDNKIVELLLGEGANGYSLDKENRTPLDLAVLSNSWKAVMVMITTGHYKEHKYALNRTLLHIAIMNGVRDISDSLINNEITDLQAADLHGDTPLHYAARHNDRITIQKLLNKRVDKNVLNKDGQNPLAEAMVSGSWEAVVAFMKGNCDVEGVDRNNRTLLHYAALDGKKDIIDHLLSCRNVDINAMDNNNETALDLILRKHHLHFVDEYCDINWRDGRGRSILHLALLTPDYYFNGYYRFGILDAEDNEGQTPLHIASSKDFSNSVYQLVESGASINKVDINGHSPLHLAAMHGHTSIIERIFRIYNNNYNFYRYEILEDVYNLRLNARDTMGRTPLQLALDNGHQGTAKLLKQLRAIV